MVYYAVAKGYNTGIFTTWLECQTQVKGFSNAIFKKFKTRDEANKFINTNSQINNDINSVTKDINSVTTTKDINSVTKDINSITTTKDINYYVYTDGACSNNGMTNAKAGIGIYFGMNDIRNVSKSLSGKQTNNTAELIAIIDTFDIIKPDLLLGKKITIVSDSKYAIKCATDYGEKCYYQNFQNHRGIPIPNKELVEIIYNSYKDFPNVNFIHCKAHTNNTDIHSLGNHEADKLANNAIELNCCPYSK